MAQIHETYWKLIELFRRNTDGSEKHHVWPRWLGHLDEIVYVSRRQHACLHYLIWLHEQSGESASAFIATATGWPSRGHTGVSTKLIQRVASWNMSRVTALSTAEQLSEYGSLGAAKVVSEKLGWHGLSSEGRTRNGRLGVQLQLQAETPARAKHWVVTHPDGTEETVYNLAEFCRTWGLLKSKMCAVAKGNRKHHKQFTVRNA